MVEGERVEAGSGRVDDHGVGTGEIGAPHQVGEDFADVPLMQGHVADPVPLEVLLGVEDRLGAEVDADDPARFLGGRHPEGPRPAVEVVDGGRAVEKGEGRVVEPLRLKRVGLEEGGGADLEREGPRLKPELFDDVVGSEEVHLVELGRAPLLRLVDAEENRDGLFGRKDRPDSGGVVV